MGLTAVLVFSTLFSFVAAHITSGAANKARIADVLDDHFRAAQYAVVDEESLEWQYQREPGKAVALDHQASSATIISAMEAVATFGDARDRSVARDVSRRQKAYLIATKRLFAAVDGHHMSLATAIDRGSVDPAHDHIKRLVQERATVHSRAADVALEQLSRTQQRIVTITIASSALGILSLGIFLLVLRTYQRRVAGSHQVELQNLEEAALTDNLTGIGNHRAYVEELDREVSRAHRHGETLSLAVIDIDDFKLINDRNGHMHGDRILTKLAALLGSLRTEDRAYRVGGDEFALVLPHTSMSEAMEMLQRFRTDLQTHLFGPTVTIGLTTLTGPECAVETLQAQADAALYSGKRAGRNCVSGFDATMRGMWLLSPTKIHNLRQLITEGSMHVVFQPIWDVEGGRALAYEALSRPDPKYGFNGPQEAFDLAERIGRAHELDAVCRDAALASAGDLPDDALLFINVSPQSLDHDRLDPLTFDSAVRAAGLTPERVVIEITERSITQVDAVIDAARALQTHGFRLALDDTGAGNSGLELMSRLTLEFVKIDREVIANALHDKNALGVLAGIVAIAQVTNAYVIAEGIENVEMLNFVCRTDVRQAATRRSIQGVQGYLLRRPSETFPKPNENDDIKALLKEFAVDRPRVLKP